MKEKPTVCLIDEDDNVRIGWTKTLGSDANLLYFQDHLELLNQAAREPGLIQSLACIIAGRYFHHIKLDIVKSNVPNTLKASGAGALFLNWQGYITKDEVNTKFDGKLFHRYGVKWQTLRLRIQKFDKAQKNTKKPVYDSTQLGFLNKGIPDAGVSKPEKCTELLKLMARRASGSHKERIEFYAYQDQRTGMQLLEAIYNRLLTDKNRPTSCPSRYINSSPVIAQRILHEALYR
jgi:hypothetical protein